MSYQVGNRKLIENLYSSNKAAKFDSMNLIQLQYSPNNPNTLNPNIRLIRTGPGNNN